jgi:hypothetical protein
MGSLGRRSATRSAEPPDVEKEQSASVSTGMRVYVNAARLRRALERLPEGEGFQLLQTLFPELSVRRLALMQLHWREMSVSGASITMPASWSTLLPDDENPLVEEET